MTLRPSRTGHAATSVRSRSSSVTSSAPAPGTGLRPAWAAPVQPAPVRRRVGPYERFGKPLIDRVLAAFLLLLLALPMLTIMLVVALTSGSPTLFRQPRVGRHGIVFTILKFRTMRPDRRRGTDRRRSPRAGGVQDRRQRHKSTSDPRVTRSGRFLRRTSLDELPQLWNVLRGDMSLVGPRPELVEIVERHYAPWQLMRHAVKPGITGPWQISDRQRGVIYEDTHLDLAYVHHVSLRGDVAILLRTAWMLTTRATGF